MWLNNTSVALKKMSINVINGFIVIFQASELLHKMHTLQLARKYVKSVKPERKAQVGLSIKNTLVVIRYDAV